MLCKSFGCSFTYGTDLADTVHRKSHRSDYYIKPSQQTWPALVAANFNMGYICYAEPGCGNLRIMQAVLEEMAANPDPAFYIVNWTYIDRFDHTDKNNHWMTIMPTDEDKKSEVYYRDIHSSIRDKITNLVMIKFVIDRLEEKGHPFVMTCMDDHLLEREWNANLLIAQLQDQIGSYIKTFDGQNFLEWTRQKNLPISPTDHPLEKAHAMAAELMVQNLDQYLYHSA